jgi:hypothetical protein
MTDVSLYVALITAGAGVFGAAVTQGAVTLRESLGAKRDRQERHKRAAREACENLLRAAGDLRTQVVNNQGFSGDRAALSARLEKVREYAAAAQLHAVSVALLLPERTAQKADDLAAAASSLADWAAANTYPELGGMDKKLQPDFGVLNACITAFRTEAVENARA